MSMDGRRRIASIDIVRGAVMVLMALDHVRDYVTELRFQPENLARGSAMLFATRWVTHFCAPTFFLLAGIGIGVARDKAGGATPALSRYLVIRGVWLLILELVVIPLPPVCASQGDATRLVAALSLGHRPLSADVASWNR